MVIVVNENEFYESVWFLSKNRNVHSRSPPPLFFWGGGGGRERRVETKIMESESEVAVEMYSSINKHNK